MRLQRKGCCRLHCWLRSGPRTQRMSLARCCSGASRKCRLIWTVTRLFDSHFDPAVETTESIVAACCHNHAEIKADVDAQVLSHAERGIRCLGIASSDADGKWVFRGNLTLTRYSSEDDHGRPRRDCEGNVSCDWCRNEDSHDQGHPSEQGRHAS